MASTMPTRRSTRKRTATQVFGVDPSDAPAAHAQKRPCRASLEQAPVRLFLTSVFSEIHSQCPPLPSTSLTVVQDLIRLTRTIVFFSSLPDSRPSTLTRRIKAKAGLELAVRAVFDIVARDAEEYDIQRSSRLKEAARLLGYPILCICLHSTTFQAALTELYEDTDVPWNQKLAALDENASTLELFAKTRNLKYLPMISSSNSHFATFLTNQGSTLTKDESQDLDEATLGNPTGTESEKHQIDSQSQFPHLWARPAAKDEPAVRSKISYPNTAQLKKEFPENKRVAEFKDQYQEEISSSIVLSHYKWPKQSQWPEDDPRYAGYERDACEKCHNTRFLIPQKHQRQDSRFHRCKCTLKDLDEYQDTPLVELFDTRRMGTGIRALQNIDQDRILDEYKGEIYPSQNHDGTMKVPARYGSDGAGGLYRLQLAMVKRHSKPKSRKRKSLDSNDDDDDTTAPVPKKKRTKTTPPRAEGTDSIESEDPAPLSSNEYTMYVVDSALKGNWTRYINHSCDPNTEFWCPNIGMHTIPLIRAIRDVGFGEEITVDYGDAYMKDLGIKCRCGVSTCLRWGSEGLDTGEEGGEMLGDAVKRGNGPGWIGGKGGKGAKKGKKGKGKEKGGEEEILLDEVIEVTDKSVVRKAREKVRAYIKKNGGTQGKGVREATAKGTAKTRAKAKAKSEIKTATKTATKSTSKLAAKTPTSKIAKSASKMASKIASKSAMRATTKAKSKSTSNTAAKTSTNKIAKAMSKR